MILSRKSEKCFSLAGIIAVMSLSEFAFSQSVVETELPKVKAVKPATLYAPSAMPDRIVLGWSGDPRTTQSVNWRTSASVVKGLAQFVKSSGDPAFSEKAVQVVATSEALKSDLSTAHFHSATLKGLEPGSVYAYRVGDGTNWSEWHQFRTASAKDSPFSFIYFGDAQNDIRSKWSRVIREAYRDAPEAAFMLHAGDLINNAETDMEWGEWFGAGAWLNAMIPSIAVPGNHEIARLEDGKRRLSHHWRPSFTQPTNGPDGLEESCFTLTYHNMALLPSTAMNDKQSKRFGLIKYCQRISRNGLYAPSTIRSTRPAKTVTTRNCERCGSRFLTSTKSTWCSLAMITLTVELDLMSQQ